MPEATPPRVLRHGMFRLVLVLFGAAVVACTGMYFFSGRASWLRLARRILLVGLGAGVAWTEFLTAILSEWCHGSG